MTKTTRSRLALLLAAGGLMGTPGAYAAGHHAHSSEAKHAGVIHDFATRDDAC